MLTIEDILASETPEERTIRGDAAAEYARPCKYEDISEECWVHGYFEKRPCDHMCHGAYYKEHCPKCPRPLTGRQRTRRRYQRQGRR